MDNSKKIAFTHFSNDSRHDNIVNDICRSAIIDVKNNLTSFLGKSSIVLKFRTNIIKYIYKNRGLNLRHQNYNLIFREFNNAYFYKNCCKSIVSLFLISKKKKLDNFNFVDIGSGAGTVSIAIKNVLRKSGKIIHIDKSSNQLKVASYLLGHEGEFINSDIVDYDDYPDNYILTASYFLCEQEKSYYNELYKHFISSSECKGIILIDYETVVVEFASFFTTEETYVCKHSIKLSRFLERVLQEKHLTTNCLAIFK